MCVAARVYNSYIELENVHVCRFTSVVVYLPFKGRMVFRGRTGKF